MRSSFIPNENKVIDIEILHQQGTHTIKDKSSEILISQGTSKTSKT